MTEQTSDVPPFPADGPPEKERSSASSRSARQMALPFVHSPRFDEVGFVRAPSNAQARAWLFSGDTIHAWADGRLVLWGSSGRGKTHLLRMWAERQNALLIDCRNGLPDPAMIPEEGPPALALDSLPVSGLDELELLRIINMAREHRVPLLMASRLPPGRWAVSLPDLESRLRATMVVELGAAEDDLLLRLMLRLLAERQLVVARPVTEWLLHRLPREARAVQEAVSRIDSLTLATGQPLDRAAAAQILSDMTAHNET